MTEKTSKVRDWSADQAICDAATAGPWGLHDAGLDRGHVYDSINGVLTPVVWDARINDARFIAEARTGWPAALNEIERLRKVIRYILADAERVEVETYLDRTYGEGWPSGYAEGKNDMAESIAAFLRKEALADG
ncbi:hypothetical protein ACX93W_01620 [Paenibacillus sp. CAU 1782]